jgi:hypothetical protein
MKTTEPAPDQDGAALLDAIHAALTKYVVMPSAHATDAVTMWIACTHAQPAWAHAPRLVIRAPERRCGKSRLLDIVEALSHNPLITVNASPAAVYRSITEDPPVLLVDEADTIFGAKVDGNEELRGLLNAGHQRGRPAIRYDAASQTVVTIATFAMAALAGIGAMPDTIEDRAVVVHMRRRAPGEKTAPYRTRRDRLPLRGLAEQITTWLRADLAVLERATPALPVEDRAADTWEPLVIVADLAGGAWPQRARDAAAAMTAEANEVGELSDRVRVLIDCRTVFGEDTALPTAELLARIRALPESGWNEYGPVGLTAMKLGVLLRDYGIRSDTIRFPDVGQAKGYHRADFADSWARYCPPPKPPSEDQSSAVGEGEPYQPYQPQFPSSERYGLQPWYGSSRTTEKAVPGLTSKNEAGTAGTATPLKLVHGDR